ncbi:MAG: hypothetical protein AAF567_06715 [Actinomycetota bacterium]
MSGRRTLAIARAHARELSRRKLAIALLIGLPLAFYFASFSDELAISFATVGFGWSAAIISLFSTHSVRAITPRLALAGFRPSEIVLGRLLAITGYALVLGTALFVFLLTDDVVVAQRYLATSLILAFLGSVATGLAVGSLLDREMEAMLILIALVALTLVVDWDSLLAKALPMYAADRYAWGSVDGVLVPDRQPWRATVIVATVMSLIAIAATFVKVPRVDRKESGGNAS